MLRKESVTDSLWNLTRDLQKSEVFKDYFLVGGTSLALQMGHRKSVDIDLFTQKSIDKEAVFNFFDKNYAGYKVIRSQNIIHQFLVNDIKVDLVRHNSVLIEDVKEEDGIRYLGKKDISAMKLMAVANRGYEAKDFVDIYFLLKEIPLEDMFEYYKIKYNQDDVTAVKIALIYFNDVSQDKWDGVEYLGEHLPAEEIKRGILKEFDRYRKKTGYY